MTKERIMIFVDHANVFKPLQIVDVRIDWERFINKLAEGCHLVGTLMYLGEPRNKSKQLKRFYSYLRKMGFVIQFKPVQETPSGKKRQKGIEVFMYQDIIELAEADSYDKAIVVSGDADLLDAIKKLKVLKKKVEVWSFKKSFSKVLRREAGLGNFRYIDSILREIEYSGET